MMRNLRAKLAVVAALSLTTAPGCVSAFDRALDDGHALVAKQRYRDAYRAYARAAKLDADDPEAQRLLAQIKPYAIKEAKADARAAISAGAYEDAADHADFVQDLDREQGAAVHAVVQRWIRASLEGLMAKSDMGRAYPLAVRAHRLYPKMEGLDAAFPRLRRHYLDASERRLGSADYAGAMEELDVIGRHEPHLDASLLRPRRARIRNAWADHVVTLAERAENDGHVGAAAALYARAFEVAGRQQDRQAMHERLRVLAEEGRFTVLLEHAGPHRSTLSPAVAAQLRTLDGVRVSEHAEEGSLLLTLTPAPFTCSQSHSVSTAVQTYQSGTQLVDNPAYATLTSDIAAKEGKLATVDADLRRVRPQARRAGRQLRRCLTDDVAPKQADRNAAQATFDGREADFAAQQVVVNNLRRRWQQASDSDEKKRLRRELDDAEAELVRRRSQRDAAKQALRSAEQALSSAESRCDQHRREGQRAQQRIARLSSDRQSLVGALAELDAQRAATPAQIEEPVYRDLSYPVEHHERRCAGPLTVDLEPAWTKPSRKSFRPAAVTRDDAHAAYPVAGVLTDPLSFPRSDANLKQDADRAASKAVSGLVSSLVKDFYASMSDRAADLAAEHPHEATDMMLSLYVAAPKQFGKQDRARIAAHLQKEYGLKQLGILLK